MLFAHGLISALLASGIAVAKEKDPCKGIAGGTDAFGVTTHGGAAYADPGRYNAVIVSHLGAERLLGMRFTNPGVIYVPLPAGTPGKVALRDGSVLELASAKATEPVSNRNSAAVFTQWVIDFPLTSEQLEQLVSVPITAVQSQIGEQVVQFQLPAKAGQELQAVAVCVASQTDPKPTPTE